MNGSQVTMFRHDLTEAEKQEVLHIAKSLTGPTQKFIDTPDWLASAHAATSMLPKPILSVFRRFRQDPGTDGVLLLRNLPVVGDTPLPITPCIQDSVERVPSLSAAVITSMMLQLGEVISFHNEKNGALVQNVVPVPGSEKVQSNAGSVFLKLHIENAFHDNRPDYVGLLCVREDLSGEARFCTSSIRHALPLLSTETRQILAEQRFVTKAPVSFGSLTNATSVHSVLLGDLDDPNVLVDFAATLPMDDKAKLAMNELRDAFFKTMQAHDLRVGDLAIVDNRVAVHGRTSFVPKYDGKDRWLQRVYAHLDNRRSRIHRKGGGPILY